MPQVPLDTLAIHLGSSRNAIYQAMFEARRKLWEDFAGLLAAVRGEAH